MKRIILISVFLMILLAACQPLAAPAPTATPNVAGAQQARLRVINQGQAAISNLVLLFPESEIAFGDLAAGAASEYRPAPKGVYNYAAYRYTLDGREVTQPVIDWVGENPRPGASFTYVIEFDPSRQPMQAVRLVEVREP